MASLLKLSPESDALHAQMNTAAQNSPEGARKVFFQSDIASLASESSKTVPDLLKLIQELQNHCLLRTNRLNGSLCWGLRPHAAADSIRTLATNERTLYEYVEDSYTKGIWLKDLKKRSGIQETLVQKAMNRLEGARLVKVVKNVRAPAQKTYMLAHLVPSDDVTGGSFFDGGDLDEGLIEEVGNLIVFHVRMNSWVEQKIRRPKRHLLEDEHDAVAGAEQDSGRKRKRTADIEDAAPPKRSRHPATESVMLQLAYPAYTRDYPSASSIHNFITTSDVVRASKAAQLTTAEIQGVIDVLVWDDKLEKVGLGYRTVRGVHMQQGNSISMQDDDDDGSEDEDGLGGGNGLTQAPCGKCPVFDICGEGGAVSAGSCEYFGDWLSYGT